MHHLERSIEDLRNSFAAALGASQTLDAVEAIRVAFLGRSGSVTHLMAQLKEMSIDEKRVLGPLLNTLKQDLTQAIYNRRAELEAQEQSQRTPVDVTAYKPSTHIGTLHPYTRVIEELENIFISMGYQVIDAPEVESDVNNFEALNIPADHPARDIQDTFWVNLPNTLMRTHTSNAQARVMQTQKPPLAVVTIGRTFRNEATDASHDFMFVQCEGMFIDTDVSMGNLIATIRVFLQKLFNKDTLDVRIRPSFFPFVEPGIEFDMSCPFCTDGCSTCKQSRWIELGGAGLIHPNVLSFSGIDPAHYSGFAWGFGVTRLVMLRYGINDIRLLHDNRLDFLQQF